MITITLSAPDAERIAVALMLAPDLTRSELLKVEQALLASGIGFTQEATPVGETGNLRASIGVIEQAHWTGGGVSGAYGTSLIYAAQRNFGGPIYARPGGWLVFEINGRKIFAKKVVQTGAHYMEAGVEQLEPLVAAGFGRALDAIVAAIGW
ncbi:MAG: hypothetical protein ACTHMX_09860 [Thermomicrobiales bacterium]